MMKKTFVTIVISILLLLNFSGCVEENNNSENQIVEDFPIAYINTTMGNIKIKLYQDLVPNTVNNFVQYAESGFYDGLVFHRVISGRMIQGGGYYPNGTYKKPIFDPIELEVHEDARNIDGAIGIGPSIYDINLTCQFYICDGAQSSLDDNYPVFGIVIEGMDVLGSIASAQVERKYDLMGWPVDDIIINSVEIKEPSN